jgi:outer membrane protein OmpA-like peptidoglycan-associated protein
MQKKICLLKKRFIFGFNYIVTKQGIFMKKRILLLAAICFMASVAVFAEKKAPKKATSAVGNSKWTLGMAMEVADFYSPKLKKMQTFKTPIALGPRVGFWRNFNSSVALGLDVASYAVTSRHGLPTSPVVEVNKYYLLYAGTAVYKFNNGYVLKEDAAVAPYIFAKMQGSWGKDIVETGDKISGFGVPIGAGINWKIANDVALTTYGGYNFGVVKNEDHIFFGIGMMADLGKAKKREEPVVEVVVDTDGDGIPDKSDACPTAAGVAQFNGCPDTDNDGIADSEDECPELAGTVELKGCPDTDGDGVADDKDACPNEKGEAKFGGCPNPDTDGDGVVDAKDKCPTVPGPVNSYGCPDKDGDGVADIDDKCPDEAGPVSTKGCPEEKVINELNFNFKNILFDLGKATIRPESNSILDNAAKVMLEELPNAQFYVDGHTDSKGSAATNKAISAERAKAVADYLISKGVPATRLTSRGFGEEQLKVSPEKTEEDYQQNRRVELVLRRTN